MKMKRHGHWSDVGDGRKGKAWQAMKGGFSLQSFVIWSNTRTLLVRIRDDLLLQ